MKSAAILGPAMLALASLTGGALAQPAPPPRQTPEVTRPAPPPPDQIAGKPAPPLPGPVAARLPPPPPPPPHGPSIRIERDAGGTVRLDVHCGDADTAKSCADLTLAIFDKANAAVGPAK